MCETGSAIRLRSSGLRRKIAWEFYAGNATAHTGNNSMAALRKSRAKES
jgi:hypothetical protein